MGAKDSKPSFISYEEAVKRVPDNELRRVREAFKRCSTGNGMTLSLDAFIREVLCDGVPTEVAEWLYQACGGTKRGIAFKDLLCGIVVLTKGSVDEKIKFLWTLYVNNQSENGVYIYKWDFARTLHLENTSLPVTNAPKTAEILTGLFGASDKVTYEQFRSWLLIHKDATVLSKWLLSDRSYNNAHDLETPTFYQSLAGVTHLEERDIIELEKCFWSLRNSAPTSQLDCESLAPLLAPPLPRAAVAGAFLAFDENRDGHVDFKELCCGLSAACRGPRTERLKFCFKIFDLDRDGVLTKQELIDMVAVLCQVANDDQAIRDTSRASTPEGSHTPDKTHDICLTLLNLKEKLTNIPKTKPVFQLGPDQELIDIKGDANTDEKDKDKDKSESDSFEFIAEDMALTQEDFLLWSVECAEALVSPFVDLIFEVCHIVLGLRPQCRHQERDIVLGWLRRSTAQGYSVGQFWYLISAEWWAQWAAYTGEPCHRHEAIVTDESFNSTSTESMGSLLYRADTASLGSASSSGVSSGVGATRHPGAIDNKRLLQPNQHKVRTLTGEGGHLRRDVTLAQHRDFELVPSALWRALALWYGGPDPLPRQVIRPPNSDVELELYPLHLKIYRHVTTQRSSIVPSVGGGAAMYGAVPAPPERQLAYTAAFSRRATVRQVIEFIVSALGLPREHVRLWALRGPAGAGDLLDDELPPLEALPELAERSLLLEMRNQDLTWPEEIGALSMTNSSSGWNGRRATLAAPQLPGATGLHNLGNTCYMNAALQSVWNTGPLTRYFNSGMHLYEVNTRNPLGTKGVLALRYGELCKEVWSRSARSVAPLRVRWCVSRWARALAGGGQHDAQELLAWLLDQLHEDLNRARAEGAPAPPGPGSGAAGKTEGNKEDQVAATAAWEQYTTRNKSIMTDLFYGQLKSKVRCDTCGHESVQFDAFNMLSLPLPMESCVAVEIRVILLDGSVPIKYGVRVNSEGTYLDVKRKLSELCNLEPELMLLVELAGARIGRYIADSARVQSAPAPAPAGLCAYQLPDPVAHAHAGDSGDSEEFVPVCAGAQPPGPPGPGPPGPPDAAEVSARARRGGGSLCMPALFCFKRSRSEVLMSQSPPGLYEGQSDPPYPPYPPYPGRSNTLPKELRKDHKSSPTLSVRSLNLLPSSPRLGGRAGAGSSPSGMHRLAAHAHTHAVRYLVAVHRKQCRLDAYFLPSQRSRPALFGVPLLVELREHMSGRAIYAKVWTQLARLLSARPTRTEHNHATDCDDSLGYEFPFTLRVVNSTGAWCGACPWSALCRGCALPTGGAPLVHNLEPTQHGSTPRPQRRLSSAASCRTSNSGTHDTDSPIARAKLQRQCSGRVSNDDNGETTVSNELTRLDFDSLRAVWGRGVMLAIDWDPTALHLRYQATREKACVEHESVRESTVEASRPIDLDHCLSAFTHNESLEQPYNCAGCRQATPATKKLQLWRLPPIMIVHLKRFQYVNNKWIKSQKVVNFPFEDFDPTAYLASVPQETILRHRELHAMFQRRRASAAVEAPPPGRITESDTDDEDKPEATAVTRPPPPAHPQGGAPPRARQRLQSSSLLSTPVRDDHLVDYHQHRLRGDQDPFDIKYRLYAVVSHSGQLSGGHYVAYARNPSGAWLCYNDSSCRELPALPAPPRLDPAAAYLLFYERQGLDYEPYLPDITGREPLVRDGDPVDPDDGDLKKMCTVM